jgi:pimeloyl-ACP methyl ester carboxylesterase
MRQITTEVGTLHVEERGDPERPTVLLWPSLYCTGSIWEPQIDALLPQYHLLILDPPGHGRSSVPPRRFSLEATARATLAVLDAFAVKDVVLVGGAWGGMVGVQLAATKPGLLRGLVLINSPLDRWRGRQRVAIVALAVGLALGGPRLAKPFLTRGIFSARTRRDAPELPAAFAAQLRSLDRRGLFRAARAAMLDRPSLLPLLPGLDLPVLAIAGADDTMWPATKARAEVGAIAGSRFVAVAGTAHLSAFEAPDVVNKLVVDFLDEVARPSDFKGRN